MKHIDNMSESELKRNKTFLKNLLRVFRDHIITNSATKYKWISVVNHIELVDDAIDIIKRGL